MTVEEMKEEIENKCINTDCEECCLCPLYDNEGSCYEDLKSEEIKKNYELMFGKEKSKMKNEFDFNELKAGMTIKTLDSDELIIGVQMKNDIVFFNKNYTPIISKKNIVDKIYSENFEVLEVYGFSDDNFNIFDISTRPLLYNKEDMNFKKYKIGELEICPNFKEGYICKDKDDEGTIYIADSRDNKDYPDSITIKKSELNDVIDALTEIRDFIKEDE